MTVRIHRLTARLGAEADQLTPAHLQQICDMHLPEDIDLDFKGEDGYTPRGQTGYDELAKDVTGLANARGGLIVIGIREDAQGCAECLNTVSVDDSKINAMTSALRGRIIPWHQDISIRGIEDAPGSGEGYILIAVGASAMAPHPVRMTSKPQYSYARRVGRTTAWLEESEIAALYRDRFRLAEEHRDLVLRVLEDGTSWDFPYRSGVMDRAWLELALVPSVPAERFVDSAHITDVSGFFKDSSRLGVSVWPLLFRDFTTRRPEVLRGRLRFDPYSDSTGLEAYADGQVYLRSEVAWSTPNGLVLNFTLMEFRLLGLLCGAAQYADWAGAYGDVDVVARLVGPDAISTSTTPLTGRFFPNYSDPVDRTDIGPVHATSTLDALTGDGTQLVACARRIAADLLADFGKAETTLLRPGGHILTDRLDDESRAGVEAWMRRTGLLTGP